MYKRLPVWSNVWMLHGCAPFTMTRMINPFSQRQSHETLVMKVIYWEAASQWHIYHRSHLLTFGCPNLLLHLTDGFLDGQRAYYTPCQIPSRRSESVRYSIVKRWLAAVFQTHLPSGTVMLKFEYYREYFRINFAQSRRYIILMAVYNNFLICSNSFKSETFDCSCSFSIFLWNIVSESLRCRKAPHKMLNWTLACSASMQDL